MINNNILFIGKIPPPAGGVGIHLQRLMDYLDYDKNDYQFQDLRKKPFLSIITNILKNDIIHIHVSNSFLRLFLIIVSKIFNKKVIFTFHGNIGRYSKLRNKIDLLSFLATDKGIVINENSYAKVKKLKSSILIPAFLPPIKIKELSLKLKTDVIKFKNRNETLFCTNANGLTYDKNNNEIYGIFGLISLFRQRSDFGLLISDPSEAYKEFFEKKNIILPSNILIINEEHDFVNIIQLSDCFIRATSTDGDSLSIKESLFYNKPVICSDSVDRIMGVILYEFENWEDLNNKLGEVKKWNRKEKPQGAYNQLLELYKSF